MDLKLHDIPNTVKKAMAALSALDVDIVNLHAAGTAAMMTAALEGLTRPDGTRPLLIAVTQLTSTDQESMERELWIEKPIAEVVMHYAENAAQAGLDGVVCSPLEAGAVHQRCGKDFLTVTPGKSLHSALGNNICVKLCYDVGLHFSRFRAVIVDKVDFIDFRQPFRRGNA